MTCPFFTITARPLPCLLCSPPGLSKFFHNGVGLRKDAVSASMQRVQHILRWFESQRQLVFYASSLLFVYEGLPSSSSSSASSSPSSLLSTLSISPTVGKAAVLSSAGGMDAGGGGEGKGMREGAGQDEQVAEYNNNNIRVAAPWDYSLATMYANHRKGGHHHHCAQEHLHGNDGASDVTTSPVICDDIAALNEEDNSSWKAVSETRLQQQPNGNGIKSQLEGEEEDGGREDDGGRRGKEEEVEGEGRRSDARDAGGNGEGDGEVEVRMIDFAHVFQSESLDHGYIYGLRHLLTVLEQILHDAS